MLSRYTRRFRSLLSLPGKHRFDHLEARIDDLEFAHHRDLNELRDAVDERAFAMAQLVERSMLTQIDRQASVSREHADAASAGAAGAMLDAARDHTNAAVAVHAERTEEQLARVRSELARLARSTDRWSETRASSGGRTAPVAAEARSVAPAGPAIDELLYLAIEDRFRGDPSVVSERQERYLPVVADRVDAEHPLLDLGCGRGEWLRLLADADVPARGIDSNQSCVEECVTLGLDASVGDLVETLAASADGSFGAITLFHVVEHLPFAVLADVLAECARVLAPGGVLIAETPNALNLRVAATNFWLDPTHVRPLHPQLLRLLAERAGFARMDDLFLHDLGDPVDVSLGDGQVDAWLTDLSRSLDGPGDYALVAWTPGPTTA